MESIVFAQLSDAHIGLRLMDNAFHRLRKGYDPHEDKLFDAVVDALEHARLVTGASLEAPLPILLVGDLTAGGTNNDFAIANAQLFQQWRWSTGVTPRSSGFNWRAVWLVPGNHDHWRDDRFQRAYSAETGNLFFEPTPWMHELTSSAGGLTVEFHAVDSNAGFRDKPNERNLFAAGKLHDLDLGALRGNLVNGTNPPSGTARVRAFLCHHAFESPNSAGPLDEEGRNLLQYLAGAHHVRTVLTGHTHVFYPDLFRCWTDPLLTVKLAKAFKRLKWENPEPCDPEWILYELRSAAVLAGPYAPGAHGFLVHRVERHTRPATVKWRTWKYQTGGREFLCENDKGDVVFSDPIPP